MSEIEITIPADLVADVAAQPAAAPAPPPPAPAVEPPPPRVSPETSAEKIDAIIAFGLVGRELVGHGDVAKERTARVLAAELRDQFETVADAKGTLKVVERGTGRPAKEALREILGSPEYSQFFAAKPISGANPHAQTLPTDGQPQAKTWFERHVEQFRENQAKTKSLGLYPVRNP